MRRRACSPSRGEERSPSLAAPYRTSRADASTGIPTAMPTWCAAPSEPPMTHGVVRAARWALPPAMRIQPLTAPSRASRMALSPGRTPVAPWSMWSREASATPSQQWATQPTAYSDCPRATRSPCPTVGTSSSRAAASTGAAQLVAIWCAAASATPTSTKARQPDYSDCRQAARSAPTEGATRCSKAGASTGRTALGTPLCVARCLTSISSLAHPQACFSSPVPARPLSMAASPKISRADASTGDRTTTPMRCAAPSEQPTSPGVRPMAH